MLSSGRPAAHQKASHDSMARFLPLAGSHSRRATSGACSQLLARLGFLSHTRERFPVGLLIDELTGLGVSLGPLAGHGILNLRPVPDGSETVSLWRVGCHVTSVT